METRNRETFAWFNRCDGAALLIYVCVCVVPLQRTFILSEALGELYAYEGCGLRGL